MELVTNMTSWLTPTTLFLLLNFTIGTIFIANRFSSGSRKHNPHQEASGTGHHDQTPARFGRPPSFIDRVKSINFNLYNSPPPESEIHFSGSDHNPNPPPSILQRVKSIKMPSFKFPQHNSEGDYAAYELMTRTEDLDRVDDKIPENDVTTEPRLGAPSLLQRVKSIKLPSLYRSEPDPTPEEPKPTRTKSESSKPVTKKKKKATAKKMTKSASERYTGREEETVEAVEKRRPETMRAERTTPIVEGGEEEGVDDKASNFINKFKQQLKLQRLDSFLRYREMLKNE
ncbi:hypothetical protein CARUB_v10005429mg [Capsella rubella]|uniref:DUF4408 domain-containing protein n=1 Tax=Capsella rubella TaxID=81985 RepID=R0F6K9_9BRAS|nr:uncharacterized protein LOC17878861 [Capsella rubella]EOA17161.1 hypothetical protein CARUB_v10005429mg [Capsella rubella]